MTPLLYMHPFAAYCHKALMAFYENGIAFEPRRTDEPATMKELEALWPFRLFPVLVDGPHTVMEASIIIEHLQLTRPGPVRLIPSPPAAALEARFMDRVFDNYVMEPMQRLVADTFRKSGSDAEGVAAARGRLDTSYAWLEQRMAGREWAAGDFGLADCAAAPALLYADWAHPIAERFGNLRAYRARLLARPSYARVLDEARPYRHLFPLGAPTDRD